MSCLVSIGAAVQLGMVSGAFGEQEKQELSTASAASQPTPGSRTARDQPSLQQRNPRYQLCKGDSFDLTFPFTPEFNQTVTVHQDGYITLTNLGDLYVAGKTVPELRELFKAAYDKILHDPVINVVLKDFEKPFFIASGAAAGNAQTIAEISTYQLHINNAIEVDFQLSPELNQTVSVPPSVCRTPRPQFPLQKASSGAPLERSCPARVLAL